MAGAWEILNDFRSESIPLKDVNSLTSLPDSFEIACDLVCILDESENLRIAQRFKGLYLVHNLYPREHNPFVSCFYNLLRTRVGTNHILFTWPLTESIFILETPL